MVAIVRKGALEGGTVGEHQPSIRTQRAERGEMLMYVVQGRKNTRMGWRQLGAEPGGDHETRVPN